MGNDKFSFIMYTQVKHTQVKRTALRMSKRLKVNSKRPMDKHISIFVGRIEMICVVLSAARLI